MWKKKWIFSHAAVNKLTSLKNVIFIIGIRRKLHNQTQMDEILFIPGLRHLTIVLQVDWYLQGEGVFPSCTQDIERASSHWSSQNQYFPSNIGNSYMISVLPNSALGRDAVFVRGTSWRICENEYVLAPTQSSIQQELGASYFKPSQSDLERIMCVTPDLWSIGLASALFCV